MQYPYIQLGSCWPVSPMYPTWGYAPPPHIRHQLVQESMGGAFHPGNPILQRRMSPHDPVQHFVDPSVYSITQGLSVWHPSSSYPPSFPGSVVPPGGTYLPDSRAIGQQDSLADDLADLQVPVWEELDDELYARILSEVQQDEGLRESFLKEMSSCLPESGPEGLKSDDKENYRKRKKVPCPLYDPRICGQKFLSPGCMEYHIWKKHLAKNDRC